MAMQGDHGAIVSVRCYDRSFLGFRGRFIPTLMIHILPRIWCCFSNYFDQIFLIELTGEEFLQII
jgi:hypothetical protein